VRNLAILVALRVLRSRSLALRIAGGDQELVDELAAGGIFGE
jgi:hypothetical protein